MKENKETSTTTIALDKSTVQAIKELKTYTSEPIQGVVIRAIKRLKESEYSVV